MWTVPAFVCLAVWSAQSVSGQGRPPSVTVEVTPKRPYVEKVKHNHVLSFDFLLHNQTNVPIKVARVQLSVLDSRKHLILRKFAENGLSSSLQSTTEIPAGKTILLLNPFSTFSEEVPLDKLAYSFVFRESDGEKEYTSQKVVTPRPYSQKTPMQLPLDGKAIVYAGHDFYAHHRRVDLTHPFVEQLGVKTNPTRFAYDFCTVDSDGKLYRTDGRSNEDWYGWGKPIRAPGSGVVTEVRNDVADNVYGKTEFDYNLALKDLRAYLGNYVVIDHRNGEFSFLVHMKQQSVRVKKGQRIVRGQIIGAMGRSGDSEYVHLHYQLQDGRNKNAETLPVAFRNFNWLLGSTLKRMPQSALESGDIVTARKGKGRRE